jgi:hypothetical protein
MKYWIESKWTPEAEFPDTIEEMHALGKTRGADEVTLEKIQEAVTTNLFSLEPHPLDYLVKNPDGTTLLGFYQTDREKAVRWVEWRMANLSLYQVYCILVEEVDGVVTRVANPSILARGAASAQGPA